MIDGVIKLLRDMAEFNYIEFTRLMSPLEVIVTKRGSCHDQVMLEFEELREMCLNPDAKFIMAVDSNDQGMETHSFVYFTLDRSWYWFENAWEDQRGLHQYPSEDELILDVMDKFLCRAFSADTRPAKVYISEFAPREHTIGEDLPDLVNICMAHAVEFPID